MRFALLCLAAVLTGAVEGRAAGPAPYALVSFGNFERMVNEKRADGVVGLEEALAFPDLYAVGATADGTGEITVVDGTLWLDHGSDGLGNASHTTQPGEKAVLLVRAQVGEWTEVAVPEDMAAFEIEDLVLAEAKKRGVDVGAPFPFLIRGRLLNFEWHVLNGMKANPGGHGSGGIFEKVTERRQEADAVVVGFYSASTQGVFTHPGESWHLHVLLEDRDMAGHLDAYAVRKGAKILLPR